MDFQMVALPLFDREMAVQAYIFRYLKGTDLFLSSRSAGVFHPNSPAAALGILARVGLSAFAWDKPAFLPIRSEMLLEDLETRYPKPADRVILLLEDQPKTDPLYLAKMAQLRDMGYRFAVQGLESPHNYNGVLGLCSYFLLSHVSEEAQRTQQTFRDLRALYPQIELVAEKLGESAQFDQIKHTGYALFENRFQYTGPVGGREILPRRANVIRLLNSLLSEGFDLEEIVQIIKGDPALTLSLLKVVSGPRLGARVKIKTIEQAVRIFGQRELRRWTAASLSHASDNPLPCQASGTALLKAKFAENLAPFYDLTHRSEELFLMGFCQALDELLGLPFEKTLRHVMVSDSISLAILRESGDFYPVSGLLKNYNRADWPQVARHIILSDLSERGLREAYLDAVIWRSKLFAQNERHSARGIKPPAHIY